MIFKSPFTLKSPHLAKAIGYINQLPPFIFIFIPLSLLFLSVNPNGNEEQYMQIAKQYINPDWIFESQNLTEVPGVRFLYQYIIGNSLRFLSFEATKFLFTLLLILGFSIVLSKIYRVLSINNQQILVHIVLFICVFKQSLFAGSWMLISVEPKGFSYLFVIVSFYYLLKSRFLFALMFLIIASYFHVLVGGWAFAYLFLTLLLFRKNYSLSLRHLIFGAMVYALFLMPFGMYLKASSLHYSPTSSEVSPSWIYTYFRNPHHTTLFKSFEYFVSAHFFGIINHMGGLLIALAIYPVLQKRKNLSLINQFVIVSMIGTLLLVPVGLIDRNGDILKFYLYRINTLSVFFLALIIPAYIAIHVSIIKKEYLKGVQALIFAICFMFLMKSALMNNIFPNLYYSKSEKCLDSLAEFVKQNTDPKSLIFNFNDDMASTILLRKAERNFFVVTKFVPAQLDQLNDWYKRVLEKRQAQKDPPMLKELVERYGIDYVITPANKNLGLNYKVVYQNSVFLLYKTGVKSSYNQE